MEGDVQFDAHKEDSREHWPKCWGRYRDAYDLVPVLKKLSIYQAELLAHNVFV